MQNIRRELCCGPARSDLPGGASPDLDCDPCAKAPVDRLLLGHVVPARDALAESGHDSQRVGVEPAVGAPDNGDEVHVLGELGVDDCLGAVKARLLRVGDQMETSRRVRALPSAEVSTCAGRSPVLITPGTSVPAEGSKA